VSDQPEQPTTRSIKIAEDERGGWSSDRPRKGGGPPRPPDHSVRGRVLKPSDLLRYSPGSLLLIVSPSAEAREAFAQRLIEQRNALMSLDKVRGLLAGRVPDEDVEQRAVELLDAAVAKRLEAGETVVLTIGPSQEERERFVNVAGSFRRPRHLILVDVGRDQVSEDDRPAVNELRRRLDAGELGGEGFHSALRLGGDTVAELKRLVFRPEPRDD
jgi:predicted kinase